MIIILNVNGNTNKSTNRDTNKDTNINTLSANQIDPGIKFKGKIQRKF